MVTINSYIKIMRLDHWIKQLFVLPGIVTAFLLTGATSTSCFTVFTCVAGLIAVSLVASANYVINEFLDAQFDQFHPTKKFRAAVLTKLNGKLVFLEYTLLGATGLGISLAINTNFFATNAILLIMGVLYNVPPIRMKDITFVDVIVESVNNMLRFLLGWFLVTVNVLPPLSILLGYWMGGAFLMAMKRFAEYRMINDKTLAATYRKSFAHYSETRLLISAFFYAMCSTFFIGIFLIKYKIELILFIPFVFVFFCYYVSLSYRNDSAAQKPEKLYKDKFLMGYSLFLLLLFFALININFDVLQIFHTNELISF